MRKSWVRPIVNIIGELDNRNPKVEQALCSDPEATMTKMQTTLLIETEQVSVIRRRRSSVRAYCENCGKEVRMLSPIDAAMLVCENTDKIYSLMNTAAIHYRYFDGWKPFICLSSLSSI